MFKFLKYLTFTFIAGLCARCLQMCTAGLAVLLIYLAKTACPDYAIYQHCEDFWDMPTFLLTALILGAIGVAWSAYNTKKINERG